MAIIIIIINKNDNNSNSNNNTFKALRLMPPTPEGSKVRCDKLMRFDAFSCSLRGSLGLLQGSFKGPVGVL